MPKKKLKHKFTPWFPENFKPVYIGIYQTRFMLGNFEFEIGYCYWDGQHWDYQEPTLEKTRINSRFPGCGVQEKQWRGLTRKL